MTNCKKRILPVVLAILLLIAAGMGMLLACLIPKCVYLVGLVLIGLGCWMMKK